jgi:hypothetical protein
MRKKLLSLGFALAALVAASAFTPASAKTCPAGTYEFQCGSVTVCCHFGALCYCS